MWFEPLKSAMIFLNHFFRSLQIGRKYLGLRPYDKYDTSVDQIELALFEFKSELILVPFLFRTVVDTNVESKIDQKSKNWTLKKFFNSESIWKSCILAYPGAHWQVKYSHFRQLNCRNKIIYRSDQVLLYFSADLTDYLRIIRFTKSDFFTDWLRLSVLVETVSGFLRTGSRSKVKTDISEMTWLCK